MRWFPALLLLLLVACGGRHGAPACLDHVAAAVDGAYAQVEAGSEGRTRVRYRDGTAVEVPLRPKRIVSTLPGLTEMVAYLDGTDALVGVTKWCNAPPGVESITHVSVMPLDLEGLLALEPDLVLVDRTLLRSDMPVLRHRFPGALLPLETSRTLAHLACSMQVLADVVHTQTAADRVDRWLAKRTALTQALAAAPPRAGVRPPRVLIVSGWEPLNVIGSKGLLHDLIRLCGCVNVACDLDLPSGPFTEELILERRPDVILHRLGPPSAHLRRRWAEVPAFAKGRVGPAESDDLARGGPRILDALRRLNAVLRQGAPMASLVVAGPADAPAPGAGGKR